MARKRDVQVGMQVTCNVAEEVYNSDACKRLLGHRVYFEPGMVGTVAVVDVPSVIREGVSFCCIDFVHPTETLEGYCTNGTNVFRCALLYANIRSSDSDVVHTENVT